MEYRVNKSWWNEYQTDVRTFRKDDILNNLKGEFSIETYDDLTYIPIGRDTQRSLADIIIEHYKKAFGIHVECRNVSDGSRRHPHTSTQLDCHVVNVPKWLKQNEDGTLTITSVRDYLTACNRMVENVCKECAKNHLNAGKLFGYNNVAFPFGIDCERMKQQREEEERKRKAKWEAHRIRQEKCEELCQEKLNNTVSNIKDILTIMKQNLTEGKVEERTFYWDSYSRYVGYKMSVSIADDVTVCINALKHEKRDNRYRVIGYQYELSDEMIVSYKYEDCTSYKTKYNVLRDLIFADGNVLRYVKEKMNITGYEVEYPENVSCYVAHNRWR